MKKSQASELRKLFINYVDIDKQCKKLEQKLLEARGVRGSIGCEIAGIAYETGMDAEGAIEIDGHLYIVEIDFELPEQRHGIPLSPITRFEQLNFFD